MPNKVIAQQLKSDRHMLQGLGVIDKFSRADRTQNEVLSEKTSYGHNERKFSEKEPLMEVDNFNQKRLNCMKTWNIAENTDSSCFSNIGVMGLASGVKREVVCD